MKLYFLDKTMLINLIKNYLKPLKVKKTVELTKVIKGYQNDNPLFFIQKNMNKYGE